MIDILTRGAQGDGLTDDTSAIQAVLNTCGEEEVCFPEGRSFRVDQSRGLLLRSGLRLDLRGATLFGPNVGLRSRVMETQVGALHIHIRGGLIVGSRDPSPLQQWGIGLRIDGAREVVIEDMTLQEHYFDGLWIGGPGQSKGVELRGVKCLANRRNGLSICNASGVQILNSEFSSTSGADPWSGVNVEPNLNEEVVDLLIANSDFFNNAQRGLYMHKGKGLRVADFTIINCAFEGNPQYALIGNEVEQLTVMNNWISSAGIGMSFGNGVKKLTCAYNEVQAARAILLAGVTSPKVFDNELHGGRVEPVPIAAMPAVGGDVVMMGNGE